MRAAAAITADAARAPAQEMRSTRGGCLDLWKEQERQPRCRAASPARRDGTAKPGQAPALRRILGNSRSRAHHCRCAVDALHCASRHRNEREPKGSIERNGKCEVFLLIRI